MTSQSVGARMKAIRDELRMLQPAFADELNRAARRLRLVEQVGNYSAPKVSRIESGRQAATLEDVLVIAALDPQKRGRDWLAWGNSTASVAELPPHPETIVEDEAPIPVAQPPHLHHSAAAPRKRARGR